ncbi:MAG: GAF domain-containing protein [Halobacteriales archaeon]|nr:GAF domain-containing protein [Halobacteriales archaeon]
MTDPIRVLHVDDDPEFTELSQSMLGSDREDFTVVTATDATTGLEMIERERIDCVISDYQMSDIDGLEFLQRVRDQWPDLPFILFTSRGSEEIASEAISAGVTDYVQKSVGMDSFEILAERIVAAVERRRAEQRASELTRINDVIRDIQRGLVSATTREQIETTVCKRLSAADRYLFAWIGEVDPETDRIVPRASSTEADSYLNEITVRTDEEPTGQGPGGRAIRTGETQVVQNVREDPTFEPWRAAAVEHGVGSVIALPLVYENEQFGLLGIYADRPEAFDETEQTVLEELRDTIVQAVQAAETRRELEQYRTLVETVGDPMYVLDTDGRLRMANDAFIETFDLDRSTVVGTSVAAVLGSTVDERIQRCLDRITEADGDRWMQFEFEYDIDGDTRVFEDNVARLTDTSGNWLGSVGTVRDITDRDRIQQQLQERNEKIEALHNVATRLEDLTDEETVFQFTVEVAENILEFDICYVGEVEDGEIVSRAANAEPLDAESPILSVEDSAAGRAIRTQTSDIVKDAQADPEADPVNEEYRSAISVPLGEFGVFQAISTEPHAFSETDRELAELLATHVTQAIQRIRNEQALRRERDRFAALFENIPDPVVSYELVDGQPIVRDVNGAFEEVFGWSADQLIDTPLDEWLLPDDQTELELAGRINQDVSRGNQIYEEVRRRTADGPREFLLRNVPFDTAGDPPQGYAIYTDITDRKERERELEEFASVVSHDLRNPLNVASGRLDLAIDTHPDDENLRTVERQLTRMERLIEDLLSLARQGQTVSDPEPTELATVIERAWSTTSGEEATLSITDDLGSIQADPDRLQRVFENLFRNAIEHAGETVTIEVGSLLGGFYIADDGPGIEPDRRESVFEAGNTTNENGTGFGLAIVKRIINAHGWEISITDSDGGGARFEITGVRRLESPDITDT